MNIMIEAAGCKAGGGIQVADSICRNLYRFPQHKFVVVLSDKLEYLDDILQDYDNVIIKHYTTTNSVWSLITGRNTILDKIVQEYNIDVVAFVFGPSLWIPKVLTVSGFAMSHLLLKDSPFWDVLSQKDLLQIRFRNLIQKINFGKLANCYYTENPYISELLRKLYPGKRVETITNSCHQIFDKPELWDKSIVLPDFDGFSLLTICSPYPHKNINSIPLVLDALAKKYPKFRVRFVLSCSYEDIPNLKENHKHQIVCLGKVNIAQCPWLYCQTDAMFLPTMLECFSASYVEAMKMKKPILTSNLGFATYLCEKSAAYFNPVDAVDMADTIYKVATDIQYREGLIENGSKRLEIFDSPEERTNKLIYLIEDEYKRHRLSNQ